MGLYDEKLFYGNQFMVYEVCISFCDNFLHLLQAYRFIFRYFRGYSFLSRVLDKPILICIVLRKPRTARAHELLEF